MKLKDLTLNKLENKLKPSKMKLEKRQIKLIYFSQNQKKLINQMLKENSKEFKDKQNNLKV